MPGSTHRALRVVATLPVGTRERIAIIQAGDAQVLIGLSPGRIQTLHVLERPVARAGAARPRIQTPARPGARAMRFLIALLLLVAPLAGIADPGLPALTVRPTATADRTTR